MFPKKKRLSKAEIAQLPQKTRQRLTNPYFHLIVFPSDCAKFAFLISTKVAAKATKRNFLRRKISQVIENDQLISNLKKAILVVVKKDFTGLSDSELKTLLQPLVKLNESTRP